MRRPSLHRYYVIELKSVPQVNWITVASHVSDASIAVTRCPATPRRR